MTEVISVKFKTCGKNYFFDPAGIQVHDGDKVIVETAKGLELCDCVHGNHEVEDTAVVQPLRPVLRVATVQDLRSAEVSKSREKEAFDICREKIVEHGLDMKLVDVESSFDGTKTTFYFTSDGRVDFRELVKDLAGIFHNRIELRQIGVRDEAKMIGGIGICGRPYCCSQFLEDFAPVSTKMAKVQSLSLNPAKISGSCGRLMCCLRYEEAAYEDLIRKVPRQGAYVKTPDGFGTAVQIGLLRQTVKVALDKDKEDSFRVYQAEEVLTVPGGRPDNPGEEPDMPDIPAVSVQKDEEEIPAPDLWQRPDLFAEPLEEIAEEELPEETKEDRSAEEISEGTNEKRNSRNRHRNRRHGKEDRPRENSGEEKTLSKGESVKVTAEITSNGTTEHGSRNGSRKKNQQKTENTNDISNSDGKSAQHSKNGKGEKQERPGNSGRQEKLQSAGSQRENTEKKPYDQSKNGSRRNRKNGNSASDVPPEKKQHDKRENTSGREHPEKKGNGQEKSPAREGTAPQSGEANGNKPVKKHYNHYRKNYYKKPKQNGGSSGE